MENHVSARNHADLEVEMMGSSDRDVLRQAYPTSWRWLRIARRVPGWLTDAEANALFELARQKTPEQGPVAVELGCWQGKSSVLLAAGLSVRQNPRLFCVDPFDGEEGSCPQAEHSDPLISAGRPRLEQSFGRNIRRCGLAHIVQAIKGYSYDVVRNWRTPIDLLFIDASHEYESVHQDLCLWAPFVKIGGVVALHDVSPAWPGPSRVMAEDLQPPYFGDLEQVDSLLWAVKRVDESLPDRPRLSLTTIPLFDFVARQREIASLSADRKYLLEQIDIHTVALTQAREKASTLEAVAAQSLRRAQSAEASARETQRLLSLRTAAFDNERSALSDQIDRLAESVATLRRELEHTAGALAKAELANRSLRSSWSWRITSPLRLLVDAGMILRGTLNRLRHGTISGIIQWLLFWRLVKNSGIFDERYYLSRYPEVARARIAPLFHFLVFGGPERRQPHFLFDPTFYLAQNPDVAASKVNPLVHYLIWGAYEGRNPHPAFDTTFYLAHNPDVAERHLNPLAHYLGPGTPEGRNPNPWFDTCAYMNENPLVAISAINPLVHYLEMKMSRDNSLFNISTSD